MRYQVLILFLVHNFSFNDASLSGPELAARMMVGARVMRGKDWKWDDQDGGPGSKGTAKDRVVDGFVSVLWDNGDGASHDYRMGFSGKYDLTLTNEKNYGTSGYTLSGPELAAQMKKGVKVIRGKDWIYGNQDAGGAGWVWEDLGKDQRVKVHWRNGIMNSYRMGYDGAYDLDLADYTHITWATSTAGPVGTTLAEPEYTEETTGGWPVTYIPSTFSTPAEPGASETPRREWPVTELSTTDSSETKLDTAAETKSDWLVTVTDIPPIYEYSTKPEPGATEAPSEWTSTATDIPPIYEYSTKPEPGATEAPSEWTSTEHKEFRMDYTYYEKVNGWLKLHRSPATWFHARLRCEEEGSILASPINKDLQTAMGDIMKLKAFSVFTGISSTIASEEFFSIEGVSLDDIPSNWVSGDTGVNQCLTMYGNNSLADTKCNESRPYICFKKNSHLHKLNHCGTDDLEYVYKEETGHCYKLHETAKNWTEAFKTCSVEGGYLMILNDDAEVKILHSIWRQYSLSEKMFSAGFYDWTKNGDWRTIHGETLKEAGYDHWAPGQPGHDMAMWNLREYCGGVDNLGKLHDVSCIYPLRFVCEMNHIVEEQELQIKQ